MASKRKKRETPKKSDGGIMALIKELWEAAVQLRGSIEPADYNTTWFRR